MAYNINPMPQTYDSTFGGIPGPIGLPDPFADLSRVLPNLGGINAAASTGLSSELSGQLSPGTQSMLQDLDAAWGVHAGVPNSPFVKNKTLRDLGLMSENQVSTGLRNYGSLIPAVSSTQTVNPNLQTQVASRNAAMNSAPNPANAQSYAQQLFDKYLQMMRGPAAGTGGYTTPSGGTSTGTFGYPTAPLTTPEQSQQINDLFNSDFSMPTGPIMDINQSSIDPFAGLV